MIDDVEQNELPMELCRCVLHRLGLARKPNATLEGLFDVYEAWCLSVPFDNVRKMIALRTQAPLPGSDAREFFIHWLRDGAGGTCWSTSNALYALLCSLGFSARRVRGAMRDLGFINHASTIVCIEGVDWLVDSSLLTNVPLHLGDSVSIYPDPVVPAEVEVDNSSHVIWTHIPPNSGYVPCRLIPGHATYGDYLTGYEQSKSRSAFNQQLYIRRNFAGRLLVLVGRTRCARTSQGLTSCELSGEEACEALCREFGLADRLVQEWVACGGLSASLEPPSGPKPPPVGRTPPSQRERRS